MPQTPGTIVFLRSSPAFPIDGATISMFERLRLLRLNSGWNVCAACIGNSSHSKEYYEISEKLSLSSKLENRELEFWVNEVQARMRLYEVLSKATSNLPDFISIFEEFMQELKPDIIFCNLRDLSALYCALEWSAKKTFVFLTENEFLRRSDLDSKNLSQIPNATLYEKIENIITTSNFLRDSFLQAWNKQAAVMTNTIRLEDFQDITSDERSFISMMHPFAHKGIDIFLGLARAMPERKFLVAGGSGKEYRQRKPEFSEIPNLTHLSFQANMKKIYSLSRLVLVPSLWEEGFSRVVLESMAAGVPVIASNTGGPPEAGEDAAVYLDVRKLILGEATPRQDLMRWLHAIEEFDNPVYYEKQVKKGKQRAQRFIEARDADISKLGLILKSIAHGN